MNTITIEILNPKVKKLLQNLSDLQLIKIKSEKNNEFLTLLKQLRNDNNNELLLNEITKEVDLVRSERYEKFKS